jgi:hypothetical protein
MAREMTGGKDCWAWEVLIGVIVEVVIGVVRGLEGI